MCWRVQICFWRGDVGGRRYMVQQFKPRPHLRGLRRFNRCFGPRAYSSVLTILFRNVLGALGGIIVLSINQFTLIRTLLFKRGRPRSGKW